MSKKHRDIELSSAAFMAMESNYHNRWIELEKIYNSEHDADFIKTAIEQERSHLFIPLGKSTVDILDAIFSEAFFSAGNPVEVLKNETKESDIASCLNVLVEHYYKEAKPYIALSMSFSSASRFGLGAVLPYWDKNRKLPLTKFIPANKIAFDMDALTRDENQYVSHKFKQTKQDISKKVKDKFYDSIKSKDLDRILGSRYDEEREKYKRVIVTEVYSVNTDGSYTCRTFIKDTLVREKKFRKCPIKHGFLTAILPTMDETKQDDQCACVGESMLDVMEDIIKENNQKRNQIVDLHEQLVDPFTMVGDEAEIDAEDAGRIKGVVNVGNPEKVKRFPPANTFPIEKEVALLGEDLNDLTAINGMQRGQTSASDRRPAAGMAIINANSSSRLSKMATTINDTLFNEWAEAFVYDIYVNAPDEVIMDLFGSNPLGAQGSRQTMKYVVNVNFGQSINRDVKISELSSLLQMLNGREDADVMPILKEVLKLILGDAFDEKSIFGGVLGESRNPATNGGVQGQENGVVGVSEQAGGSTKAGDGETVAGAGDTYAVKHDGAAKNQI